MASRIIEIQKRGTSLSKKRGVMLISHEDGDATVPINDISVLVLPKSGVNVSTNLMATLIENGACILLLSANYEPLSLIASPTLHTHHHKRIKMQIAMSEPLKKTIWKKVVTCKVKHQSEILKLFKCKHHEKVLYLSKVVKSGDINNIEAQAAHIYFPDLIGKGFVRQTQAEGINGMLNYGYAVLRSAMARAIVARGLSPTLGIFHKNKQNPFCLVDDFMEPFRPLIDKVVKDMWNNEETEVTPNVKKQLAGILDMELYMENSMSPVSNVMLTLVDSYVKSLENKKEMLVFPESILPFGD